MMLHITSCQVSCARARDLPAPRSSGWPMHNDVAIDAHGNVYVTNNYDNSITKFDEKGNNIKIITQTGSGIEQISGPQGIAVGPNGEIFISEAGNNCIKKMDCDLNTLDTWGSFGGSGSGYFTMPLDCDVYENEEEAYIFVNEFWNCRVQKFYLNGSVVSVWGTKGSNSGQFRTPEALAVGPDGSVYVSDSGNRRVQKFEINGNFITEWGGSGSDEGQFGRNTGIETDPTGEYVYVVDMGYARVQKFTSDGDFVLQWYTDNLDDLQFSPRGIDVDEDGFIYIAEEGRHQEQSRVQKFTPDGDLIQFWYMKQGGSTGTPRLYDVEVNKNEETVYVLNQRVGEINKYSLEGELINSWSFAGSGIAVDSEGYLYIVLSSDNKIIKVKLY